MLLMGSLQLFLELSSVSQLSSVLGQAVIGVVSSSPGASSELNNQVCNFGVFIGMSLP